MREIVHNIFMLTIAAAVSVAVSACMVDEDYDLGKLQTGDIGIGSAESKFDIPLATLTLDAAELIVSELVDARGVDVRSGDDEDENSSTQSEMGVLGMLSQINALLPSDLEGTQFGDGIEIDKLDDGDYVGALVEAVVLEYVEDDAKRDDFCEMIINRCANYPDQVDILNEQLGVDIYDADLSAADLSSALKEALENENTSLAEILTEILKDDVIAGILAEIKAMTNIDMEMELEEIELDDSIYDIIGKNLEGEYNALQIGTSVSTNITLSMTLSPSIEYAAGGEEQTLPIISIAELQEDSDVGKIEDVEQLKALLTKATVKISAKIDTYSPMELLDNSDYTMTIKLVARKSGSISF